MKSFSRLNLHLGLGPFGSNLSVTRRYLRKSFVLTYINRPSKDGPVVTPKSEDPNPTPGTSVRLNPGVRGEDEEYLIGLNDPPGVIQQKSNE